MKTMQEKEQELETALREAVTNPTNESFFKLIAVAAMVHRMGSGLVWMQTKAIVDKVLPPNHD